MMAVMSACVSVTQVRKNAFLLFPFFLSPQVGCKHVCTIIIIAISQFMQFSVFSIYPSIVSYTNLFACFLAIYVML